MIGRRAGGVNGPTDRGIALPDDIACCSPGDRGPGERGNSMPRACPGGDTALYLTRAGVGEYGGGGPADGK